MRRGGRFRADWLRSTSPLPPTSFPAPSLETNSLAGPSLLYLPWRQVVPPPQLHHLSTEFPAHCPKNIPPSSAQIGIRIQWRYPTMLSGGERRWLRCSFECLIYFFILLIVILLHSLFNQILIIYWNEKVFFFSHWFAAPVKANLFWLLSQTPSFPDPRSMSECSIIGKSTFSQ